LEERPVHSENAVAFIPSISNRKLRTENGSTRVGGGMTSLLVAESIEV
jgi:hypothetical protein